MNHVNVQRLERYFMLLTALEDNLCEYQNIKADLQEVTEADRTTNDQYVHAHVQFKRNIYK